MHAANNFNEPNLPWKLGLFDVHQTDKGGAGKVAGG